MSADAQTIGQMPRQPRRCGRCDLVVTRFARGIVVEGTVYHRECFLVRQRERLDTALLSTSGLGRIDLGNGDAFYVGDLPPVLRRPDFETLWRLHPETYHVIRIHGRDVPTPRWQQAYGADYHYTGRVNKALPVPLEIQPLLDWARAAIDSRLNGVLLNWYDAALGHYIGKHRDSTRNMIPGSPIVTISLGSPRTFRLRPWRGQGVHDLLTEDGGVFVMPYTTNLRWTHEVPHFARDAGRRISVTLRAFERGTKSSPVGPLTAAAARRAG